MENNLIPCKNLDYSPSYSGCKIETVAGFPNVKYWFREYRAKENLEHNENYPINVQFCKKRGRINAIFDCYQNGCMSCYEPVKEK